MTCVAIALGAYLRLDQFLAQVLIDDEWHAVHQVMHRTPKTMFLDFGFADYSIPLGILAAKRPSTEAVILGATGVIQTIPSLALLAVLIPVTGRIGVIPAMIALALYALLPIVRNTHAGLTQISRGMRQAAR